MSYTIRIGSAQPVALDVANITDAVIHYVANGINVLEFTADSDLAEAGLTHNTDISIYKDDVRIFVGYVELLPGDEGGDTAATKRYTCPCNLSKVLRPQYTQVVSALDASNPSSGLSEFVDPRVVMGLDASGSPITNTQQIADIIDYAIGNIPGFFQRNTAAWPAGFLCAPQQIEIINCLDAVVSQLRLIPDHVLWVDYTATPPKIMLTQAASLTAASVNVLGLGIAVSATPRHDLVMPGVNVYFRRLDSFDGAACEARYVQSAGNNMDPLATALYVDLDGGQTQTVRQEVFVIPYPDFTVPGSATLKTWLEARAPWLKDVHDYTITAFTRSGSEAFENELIKGTIAKWMPVSSEEETLTFTVSYTNKDDEGNYMDSAEVQVPVQVTSTNATSRQYSKIAASDSGELPPAGLADGIYAAWSKLHWDGSITLPVELLAGLILPGSALNIIGAHASLETMAAIVQKADLDLSSDDLSLTYGTCRALEADSFTAIYRALRYRRSSTRIMPDDPPEDASDSGPFDVPRGSASTSPALKRQTLGVSSTGKRAVIDVADLSTGDVAIMRDLIVPTPAGIKSHKVLATEAVDPAEDCELKEKELQFWTSIGLVKMKVPARAYELVTDVTAATARNILQVVPSSGAPNVIALDYPRWV